MSNQQSSSFTSYSSMSYSSSGSVNGQQVSGSRHMQTTQSDDSGTTTRSATQRLGEPVVQEERHYDSQGRELLSGPGTDSNRRIEDVDEAQRQRDKEYEERIEEEYAKREGGA